MDRSVEEAHQQLVDRLIAQEALWSAPLIEAFRATPRHRFLDRIFQSSSGGQWHEVSLKNMGPAELRLAYSDRALTTRLSRDGAHPKAISSSSQPSLMAQMLEELRLRPGLRTLEIGAGTGYNAALLAHVVGPMVSLDVDAEVLAEARAHLRHFPDRRVKLRHGDGRDGGVLAALPGVPFQRIQVTAATPDLQPAWLESLTEKGLLMAPLALAPGLAFVVLGQRAGPVLEARLTRAAYFMPLRNEEAAEPAEPAGDEDLPAPGSLSAVAAPWAAWQERRPANGLPGFLTGLTFLAWLQGLRVAQANGPDGWLMYGVCDPDRGHLCWLGRQEWRVSGSGGQELGQQLWRTFLRAGGPRPPEFRLRATPRGEEECFAEAPADSRLVQRRTGVWCQQTWFLPPTWSRPG
jgi:protein-L-isoaspartate O-methyltransferase